MMQNAVDYFKTALRHKKMRFTKQREALLRIFLAREGHICADELYRLLRKRMPDISPATVYRTVNLLKNVALAAEVNFSGKRRRFEHAFEHPHHDHLICLHCGKTAEFVNPSIEKIQERVVKGYAFVPLRHRLEIFGYCRSCQQAA